MRQQINPYLVSLDVTNRCNLACLHCYNDSGTGAGDMYDDPPRGSVQKIAANLSEARISHSGATMMTVEELLLVAEKIIALSPLQVCLCGGEPILCPSLFEVIHRLRPHVGKLVMVSNGFLIDEKMAARLVAGGIDSIQISLDGAFSWQHDSFRGVKGAFDRAVAAVKNLKHAGMGEVAASMILNKINHLSLARFLPLCASIGVDSVRIMEMLPLGRGAGIWRHLSVDAGETFHFCRELSHLLPIYSEHMSVEWLNPAASSRFVFHRGARLRSPLSLSIRADGEVRLDPYLPFSVGNILREDFHEKLSERLAAIWDDQEVCERISRLYSAKDFEAEVTP